MSTSTSGSTALISAPARLVVVLEVDQVDRPLVREQLQPLVLGHHRAVVALAPADLRVAVDADDQDVAELLRLRRYFTWPRWIRSNEPDVSTIG